MWLQLLFEEGARFRPYQHLDPIIYQWAVTIYSPQLTHLGQFHIDQQAVTAEHAGPQELSAVPCSVVLQLFIS